MEDGQLDFPAVAHVGNEIIVPGGAVGLLLGGRLADPRVVNVDRDVRVEQESLGPGTHCVSQRPRGGLQVDSLADPDLQQPVEDDHRSAVRRGGGDGEGRGRGDELARQALPAVRIRRRLPPSLPPCLPSRSRSAATFPREGGEREKEKNKLSLVWKGDCRPSGG